MIIDFHTHIFPDALAHKALSSLFDGMDGLYTPVHDGTADGLLRNMDAWGVDISVIAPVVTKQSQARKVNEWTANLASDRFVCFGGIYPHVDDYKSEVDFAVSLGLKGLKFHAEFQDFIVDAPKMLRIYDYALSRGLILLHHAGFDPAFPPPFRSDPKRFANVLKAMPGGGGKIVIGHLGGQAQWDDVEKYLAGSEAYLDTSMGFEYYTEEQFLRIAQKHGVHKLLFASDSPWSNAGDEIARIKALPLEKKALDAILGANACSLLGISGERLLRRNHPRLDNLIMPV